MNALTHVRVLVVEDEGDGRDLLVCLLQHAGAEVVAFATTAEAFEALCRFSPDVVVSDVAMPGEDGYSFMRRVRLLPQPHGRVAALAVTAFDRAHDRERAHLAGFDKHLAKPVESRELVSAIALLARRGRTSR